MGSQPQLFEILRTIEIQVEDRDYRGLLVAYAVLDSLVKFTTPSGCDDEKKFGQVKAVYSGLQRVLDCDDEQGRYGVLCDFRKAVEPLVRKESGAQPTVASPRNVYLSASALSYIERSRGDHDDIMRRLGIGLVQAVKREGRIEGNARRVLLGDFDRLAGLFRHDSGENSGGKRR